MNEIIGFFIAIFLFVSSFIAVGSRICDNVNRRVDKQNINLIGKTICGYAQYDVEKGILINEDEYISEIKKLTKDAVIGGIFVYNKSIRGIDTYGDCFADISVINATEEEIILIVNNMMYELIQENSPLTAINIACSDDYIKNKLFNDINGTTVFIISCREQKGRYQYNVAGYKLDKKTET